MKIANGFAMSLIAALGLGVGIAAAQNSAPAKAPSHSTTTTKVAEVNAPAPDFTLTDISGKTHRLADLTKQGKTVVIEWFNPECPIVVRHYDAGTMVNTYNEFKDQNVAWILVNSGAPGMQGAGAEKSKAGKQKWGFQFPVLLDESGEVGRMYGAKVTPHIFIVDKNGVLAYAGGIDNDPRGAKKDTAEYVNYVEQALEQVLAGETVTTNKTEAYGCSVKYGK